MKMYLTICVNDPLNKPVKKKGCHADRSASLGGLENRGVTGGLRQRQSVRIRSFISNADDDGDDDR